jgi:hypothetical protein
MPDPSLPVEAPAPAPQTPQASPEDPGTKLRRLEADKGWRDRLDAGDSATRDEWKALIAAEAGADRSDDPRLDGILSGETATPPSFESLTSGQLSTASLIEAVRQMKELGISDAAIKDAVNGGKISRAEYDMVRRFQAERESDRSWVEKVHARWPTGLAEKREHRLIHIALTSEVVE